MGGCSPRGPINSQFMSGSKPRIRSIVAEFAGDVYGGNNGAEMIPSIENRPSLVVQSYPIVARTAIFPYAVVTSLVFEKQTNRTGI